MNVVLSERALSVSTAQSADDAVNLIKRLCDIVDLMSGQCVAVMMTKGALDRLMNRGEFPFKSNVERVVRRFGIDFDQRDVVALVSRVLQRALFLEDVVGGDVLCEACDEDAEEHGRLVVLGSLVADMGKGHVGVCSWHPLVAESDIEQRVRVLLASGDCESRLGGAFPRDVVCRVACSAKIAALFRGFDFGDAAARAESDEQFMLALRGASILTRLGGKAGYSIEAPRIRLHRKFYECLRGEHVFKQRQMAAKLVRRAVMLAEQRGMSAVHAWRGGRGGNEEQVIRAADKAAAWRADIDDEYHLHYWACPDGWIELASVGPHSLSAFPA
ncbi:MAG: hypothetical protein IT457_15555 [Planctomycetes bacterium]|nr:hypothetical protein [Planctomycetota bacterium]